MRMKISTGIGFRRRPELVLLSPLSLEPLLILELLLSRRCRPSSKSEDSFLNVGLSGLFKPEVRLAKDEMVGTVEDADADAEALLLFFFVKRGIQNEDEGWAERSANDPIVDVDQRDRSVRSGSLGPPVPRMTSGLSGMAGEKGKPGLETTMSISKSNSSDVALGAMLCCE